ncbi:MAG: WD40 repeat domain-containing protein [Deltaproteobacteria bacterium]|nr:WD40 repeat domain-containing protein [Deltaproteobacteria bacterium]
MVACTLFVCAAGGLYAGDEFDGPRGVRELQRIEKARACFAGDEHGPRWSEGFRELQTLLDGQNLLFRAKDGSLVELHLEIHRLLYSLPAPGKEAYNLQHGTEQKKKLEQALENSDYKAASRIADRFLSLDAGKQAAWIMAVWHMDHGRAHAAAQYLNKLLDVYEDNLSTGMLAYSAMVYSGINDQKRKDKATTLLAKVSATSEIVLAGKKASLEETLAVMDRHSGRFLPGRQKWVSDRALQSLLATNNKQKAEEAEVKQLDAKKTTLVGQSTQGNFKSEKPLACFTQQEPIIAATFSKKRFAILSSDQKGNVVEWNLETKQPKILTQLKNEVDLTTVRFLQYGNFIVAGETRCSGIDCLGHANEDSVVFWKWDEGEYRASKIELPKDEAAAAVDISDDGTRMALLLQPRPLVDAWSSSHQNGLFVFDLTKEPKLHENDRINMDERITSFSPRLWVKFMFTNHQLLLTSYKGDIVKLDSKTAHRETVGKNWDYSFRSGVSADGQFVHFRQIGGRAGILNLKENKVHVYNTLHYRHVHLSPDGQQTILVPDGDGQLTLLSHSTSNAKLLQVMESEIDVSTSREGTGILSSKLSQLGGLFVPRMPSHRAPPEYHYRSSIHGAADSVITEFSPDGKLLLATQQGQTQMCVWSADSESVNRIASK